MNYFLFFCVVFQQTFQSNMAILTLKNNNMVKNIIIEQAKQIAELKRQLNKYKSIVNNSISTNNVVKNESLPLPLSSIPSPDYQEAIPTNKSKSLKLVLPTKHTFKKRVKASIELDGYNHDAHFQHLLLEDSKLPYASKNYRWNFAFRFCAYFVHAGRKIFIKTLVHGQKKAR